MENSTPSSVVSCIVAVDGGERMAADWNSFANGYIPAILRQLANLYPTASLQISSIIINSLPPTSRQPLLVRPFQPVTSFVATLPNLVGKGKARESTFDIDYALIEGLTVAAMMLEARKSVASYILVVSAQDIPNTNFWDEDVPNDVPLASAWPGITGLNESYLSNAWQALMNTLNTLGTHLCTISSRLLPRLEEFQRKVAAGKGAASQTLPNLQDPEHAILLSGFQLAQGSNKRPHSESITSRSPQNNVVPLAPGPTTNKRVKLSPASPPKPLAKAQSPAAPPPQSFQINSIELQPAPPTQPPLSTAQDMFSQAAPPLASLGSVNIPASNPEATTKDLSQNVTPSTVIPQQPTQQQITALELNMKREEVKSQMKQFMTQLANMSKAGNITLEKAKTTAEKVRTEAIKKLQMLDALEQQSKISPTHVNISLPKLDAQQPPLIPSQNLGINQDQNIQANSSSFPQPSSSTVQQVQWQQTTPTNIIQQTTPQSVTGLPGSPQKNTPPVWSGPIQWSLVDPINRTSKKQLAFFVDAVPLRANAAAELMNVSWPSIMEIAHITPMSIAELQKYAQDNRIQVVSFVKATPQQLENVGMAQGQNDNLYHLLAKSLESKSSVAIVRLPGANRGVVIVALPGQNKLVGLIFLTTPLPPRTPGSVSQLGLLPPQNAFQQMPQGQQQQQQQSMPQVQSQPQMQAQQSMPQNMNFNPQAFNQFPSGQTNTGLTSLTNYQLPGQTLLQQQPAPSQLQQRPSQNVAQAMQNQLQMPMSNASFQQSLQSLAAQSMPAFNMPYAANMPNPPNLTDAQVQEMFLQLQRQQQNNQ